MDWDRDLNYVRSHALQTPSESRSGSVHCELIFCSYCAVRADWPMRLCMASARIFKMHESRSERALRSHCPRIRLSRRITTENALFRVSKRVSIAWFETALRSHGLKSGFQIRKGQNHVLKRLSERDSSPCEHSQCNSLRKSLVWEGIYHRFLSQSGVWHPILISLVWESRQHFLPPSLPLSSWCQTPMVINPSVIITAVVLSNSINEPLSDGPALSTRVHKQLVPWCVSTWRSQQGHMLIDRSGEKHSSEIGVYHGRTTNGHSSLP